jgi:hypothetical protein
MVIAPGEGECQMTEKQWETFFDLVDRIVDMEGMTANEKASLFRDKMAKYGSEGHMEELVAWIAEE